jgi:fumarylacetoacetate (FAA) hydrolase family protein
MIERLTSQATLPADGTVGTLVNRANRSDEAPPWTFGARELMRNLADRGLI